MGPTPSADLVGSIIGVEDGDDYKSQRPNLRKAAAERTAVNKNKDTVVLSSETTHKEPAMQIVWRNVLIFIYLHAAALYGFFLCFTAAKWATLGWCKILFPYYCFTRTFFLYFCDKFFYFCSFLFISVWGVRNNGWRPSTLGSSLLQSQMASTTFRCPSSNDCSTGEIKFTSFFIF